MATARTRRGGQDGLARDIVQPRRGPQVEHPTVTTPPRRIPQRKRDGSIFFFFNNNNNNNNNRIICTMEETADAKSQTFRKRRLTYSKLKLDPAAVAALENLAADDDDGSDDENANGNDISSRAIGGGNVGSTNQDGSDSSPVERATAVKTGEESVADADADGSKPSTDVVSDPDDNFSRTFRKRRLTLTKHQVATALAAVVAEFENDMSDNDEDDDEDDDEEDDDDENLDDSMRSSSSRLSQQEKRKKRRLSESSGQNEGQLKSKVVHAGEIMRSTADTNAGCQLYNFPHRQEQILTDEQQSMQPSWMRRITRRNSENEVLLPFPRTVVGTFSCHGIEPKYTDQSSDDESDDNGFDPFDDEEDDGDGNNDNNTAGNENTNPLTRKVTTGAKINQDRGGIAFPYGNCNKTALFAVYDGETVCLFVCLFVAAAVFRSRLGVWEYTFLCSLSSLSYYQSNFLHSIRCWNPFRARPRGRAGVTIRVASYPETVGEAPKVQGQHRRSLQGNFCGGG